MGLFDSLKRGLERSREALNEVFYFCLLYTSDAADEL